MRITCPNCDSECIAKNTLLEWCPDANDWLVTHETICCNNCWLEVYEPKEIPDETEDAGPA